MGIYKCSVAYFPPHPKTRVITVGFLFKGYICGVSNENYCLYFFLLNGCILNDCLLSAGRNDSSFSDDNEMGDDENVEELEPRNIEETPVVVLVCILIIVASFCIDI